MAALPWRPTPADGRQQGADHTTGPGLATKGLMLTHTATGTHLESMGLSDRNQTRVSLPRCAVSVIQWGPLTALSYLLWGQNVRTRQHT